MSRHATLQTADTYYVRTLYVSFTLLYSVIEYEEKRRESIYAASRESAQSAEVVVVSSLVYVSDNDVTAIADWR